MKILASLLITSSTAWKRHLNRIRLQKGHKALTEAYDLLEAKGVTKPFRAYYKSSKYGVQKV